MSELQSTAKSRIKIRQVTKETIHQQAMKEAYEEGFKSGEVSGEEKGITIGFDDGVQSAVRKISENREFRRRRVDTEQNIQAPHSFVFSYEFYLNSSPQSPEHSIQYHIERTSVAHNETIRSEGNLFLPGRVDNVDIEYSIHIIQNIVRDAMIFCDALSFVIDLLDFIYNICEDSNGAACKILCGITKRSREEVMEEVLSRLGYNTDNYVVSNLKEARPHDYIHARRVSTPEELISEEITPTPWTR